MVNITALAATAANPLDLAPIIYAVVAVLAIFGALMGLWRGLLRQTVRIGTIILSIIGSFVLVTVAYKYLDNYLADKTVADVESWMLQTGIISHGTDTSWMQNLDIETMELVLSVPLGLILMPILFVLCFIVLSLLMLIVHAIVCAICGFKSSKNTWTTRLIGMGVGFLQGAVVAGILLMPVIGISTMAEESVTILNEEAPEAEFTETVTSGYDAYVKSVADNPVTNIFGNLGINALYEGVATVKVGGKSHNITALLPDITKIVIDAAELDGADPQNLTPENEASIESILNTIENNSYLSEILSGSVRALASIDIRENLGDSLEEPYLTILADAVAIFKTSDSQNIHTDLDTIVEVYFILSRDGVITAITTEDSDAILDVLVKRDANGETTVNRVIYTLQANDRTKPLVDAIAKISVTVMSDKIGIEGEVLEVYENIKTSINEDILSINKADYENEEDYVADVSDSLDNLLRENEIELEKEIVDTMAEYVADNFSDLDTITDEQVSSIIISYYDAYVDYIENGTIPDDIPDNLLP